MSNHIFEMFDIPAHERGHGAILGSLQHYGTLEVTINYPRTKMFMELSYVEKKRFLQFLLEYSLAPFKVHKCHLSFEDCQSGVPHLHAAVVLIFDCVFYDNGLVLDIVKRYLTQLPKMYFRSHSSDKNMNYLFRRFNCPSIVVQYRDIEDEKRFREWCVYINKNYI